MLKSIGVRVSFGAPHDSFLAQFGRAAPRHGEGHWFKSGRNYHAPVDKLVKSALSKGAVLSVRIRPGVPFLLCRS